MVSLRALHRGPATAQPPGGELVMGLWPGRDLLGGFRGAWHLGHSVSVWVRLGLSGCEGGGPATPGDPELLGAYPSHAAHAARAPQVIHHLPSRPAGCGRGAGRAPELGSLISPAFTRAAPGRARRGWESPVHFFRTPETGVVTSQPLPGSPQFSFGRKRHSVACPQGSGPGRV